MTARKQHTLQCSLRHTYTTLTPPSNLSPYLSNALFRLQSSFNMVFRYHIYLIFIGQTTNEQLRGVFEVRTCGAHLPFFPSRRSFHIIFTLSITTFLSLILTLPSQPDSTIPYPTLPLFNCHTMSYQTQYYPTPYPSLPYPSHLSYVLSHHLIYSSLR